jgi:hypothetical protein
VAGSVDDRTEEERGLKVSLNDEATHFPAKSVLEAAEGQQVLNAQVSIRLCLALYLEVVVEQTRV